MTVIHMLMFSSYVFIFREKNVTAIAKPLLPPHTLPFHFFPRYNEYHEVDVYHSYAYVIIFYIHIIIQYFVYIKTLKIYVSFICVGYFHSILHFCNNSMITYNPSSFILISILQSIMRISLLLYMNDSFFFHFFQHFKILTFTANIPLHLPPVIHTHM